MRFSYVLTKKLGLYCAVQGDENLDLAAVESLLTQTVDLEIFTSQGPSESLLVSSFTPLPTIRRDALEMAAPYGLTVRSSPLPFHSSCAFTCVCMHVPQISDLAVLVSPSAMTMQQLFPDQFNFNIITFSLLEVSFLNSDVCALFSLSRFFFSFPLSLA